jgi:CHAT domain-containing protein
MFILGDLMPLLRDAGVSTLIVSPDGLLHQVPFAALRVPDAHGEMCDLIDLLALQLVPTASSLAILRNLPVPAIGWVPNLLAAAPFGDFLTPAKTAGSAPVGEEPHVGGRVWRDLQPEDTTRELPASDDEIEEIAAILRASAWDVEVLHGPRATREAILAHLPRVNILHLSTHGSNRIANDPIMRYRILLANRTSIQVQEIYDDLFAMQHVWLVCLSACHLGEVVLRGTDALGFSQALLEAGVRVVLMPIWAVDDAASAELMKGWYRHLVEEHRPDVARAWQRAVQDVKTRKHWSSPMFWAGFLPVGDGALRLAPVPYPGSDPGSH